MSKLPFRIMKSKYGGRCLCNRYCESTFAVGDTIAWQGGQQMPGGQFSAGTTWCIKHVPVSALIENWTSVLTSPLVTAELLVHFRELGLTVPEDRLPTLPTKNVLTDQIGRELDLNF